MFNIRTDIAKRSIQTTITLPLHQYIKLVEKAKIDKVSVSEIVRQALFKCIDNDDQDPDLVKSK